MGESGMYDFLAAARDCCKDITTSWIISSNLDPEPLQRLRNEIQEFALERGSDIISMYEFVKGKGRYAFVDAIGLMQIVCDYEAYHDEFAEFIKTVISPDWRISDREEALRVLEKGKEADINFRKNLFSTEAKKTLVAEAINDLDAIMALTILIGKVYDIFVFLNSSDVTESKAREAINIYQESTVSSLYKIFELYVQFLDALIAVRDGGKWDINREQPFKLI